MMGTPVTHTPSIFADDVAAMDDVWKFLRLWLYVCACTSPGTEEEPAPPGRATAVARIAPARPKVILFPVFIVCNMLKTAQQLSLSPYNGYNPTTQKLFCQRK